jgi:hypothetical protein
MEFIVTLTGNRNIKFTVGSMQFLIVTLRGGYSITDKVGQWNVKIQ